MTASQALFWYMASFLSGVYTHSGLSDYLIVAFVVTAISLASARRLPGAMVALSAALFGIGGNMGRSPAEAPAGGRTPGWTVLEGKAGVVTENGLFLYA